MDLGKRARLLNEMRGWGVSFESFVETTCLQLYFTTEDISYIAIHKLTCVLDPVYTSS